MLREWGILVFTGEEGQANPLESHCIINDDLKLAEYPLGSSQLSVPSESPRCEQLRSQNLQ